MTWWGWMILGAVMLGAELFAIDAQFYLVFLGISAALVGLADLVGITLPDWAQWTAFAALSLMSFFTFRKSLYAKIHAGALGFQGGISGDTVNIEEEIEIGGEARINHRGSKWTARNVGIEVIAAGSRAKVVKVDGLTLHIESD